ncbi:MAG: gluconokinase [Dietzia psychralcaliphila]
MLFPHIVVMGVSGAGKSTVARAIAERLDAPFVDADDLHPPANRRKLGAGEPLTDDDRSPWLAAVRDQLRERDRMAPESTSDHGVVIACSALRRAYRDVLRDVDRAVFFVELGADPELLADRLAARRGHFASHRILESQLATLEPLDPDENGIAYSSSLPVEQIVDRVLAALRSARRR